MDNERLKLILALWGAVLSSILAILKIFQDQKEVAIKLFIDCQELVINDKTFIMVFIANVWKRPVTVIEFSFGLGTDGNYQKNLYTYSFNPMLKLEESEPFKVEIDKIDITKAAEKLLDEDFMFSRLWLNVKLSSGKRIKKAVYLDPKAHNISIHPKYDEFLVTAEFFKRDVLDEYNKIWTRKMKYDRK